MVPVGYLGGDGGRALAAQDGDLFGATDLGLGIIQMKAGEFSQGEKTAQNENRTEGRAFRHSTVQEVSKRAMDQKT